MTSPNLTVASATARRRKPPTTTTTAATVKVSLLSPDAAKTPKPTKLRKPTPVAATGATSAGGPRLRSASPARSPRPPPPPGIAPSGRGNARPARQSRAASTQSAPSIRKTPMAQMREEYDELKRKNNENIKKMAHQEVELKRLKAQLLHKAKLGVASSNAKNNKGGDGGSTQAEMLQAKETLIQEQDEELRRLRQQLEEQLRVQTTHANDPVEKEEEEATLLEKLRMENEAAVKQLAEVTKELEELRLLQRTEKGDGANEMQPCEAQKVAQEESIKQYEAALAEKDKLLLERQQALEMLEASHNEAMRHVREAHSKEIQELTQQHAKEMRLIREKLAKSTTVATAEDNAKLVEDELQRMLHEFEQEEHLHPVEQVIKQHSSWTSRFLPTEAMSWPAPQPLSILKKTGGPKKTTAAERIAKAANGDYAPILTPLDTKSVQIYISTVSANPQVKRRQEEIQQLLTIHHVKFELVDVASSEPAFQYMKRANNNGSSEGRPKELPQLFVGGEYRGQFEEVVKSAEDGSLDEMLRPAAERDWTPEERTALQKAVAAANTVLPPPVRVLPAGPVVLPTLRKTSTSSPGPIRPHHGSEDEDEALLRELEREILSGKTTVVDIVDL